MATLFLVRHGKTSLNKGAHGTSAERIRGWSDVPLDKEGQREAVAIAARFGREGVGKVYTSDLQRAMVVAGKVGAVSRCPVVETDRLRPWNLGIMTGKEVDRVIGLMNQCVENPKILVPDGESFDQFRMRYLPFLARMLHEAKTSPSPIVAVTHSRNLQLTRAWDKAGRPADYSFDTKRMLDYKDEVPPGKELEMTP